MIVEPGTPYEHFTRILYADRADFETHYIPEDKNDEAK